MSTRGGTSVTSQIQAGQGLGASKVDTILIDSHMLTPERPTQRDGREAAGQ